MPEQQPRPTGYCESLAQTKKSICCAAAEKNFTNRLKEIQDYYDNERKQLNDEKEACLARARKNPNFPNFDFSFGEKICWQAWDNGMYGANSGEQEEEQSAWRQFANDLYQCCQDANESYCACLSTPPPVFPPSMIPWGVTNWFKSSSQQR